MRDSHTGGGTCINVWWRLERPWSTTWQCSVNRPFHKLVYLFSSRVFVLVDTVDGFVIPLKGVVCVDIVFWRLVWILPS